MTVDYLVTGGAGFIGCALAKGIPAPGRSDNPPTIVAVDVMHPQVHLTAQRPEALPDSVLLRTMDVCDPGAWDALLADVQPRVIVHLAAETGTGQSLDLPTRHSHTNVTGTAEMLEALNRADFIPQHIVLSSSRAVYGEGAWTDPTDGAIFFPQHRSREQLAQGRFAIEAPSGAVATPVLHNHWVAPPQPTSVYGATKLAQENVLKAWCTARDVPLSILRFQNVYGVGQSPHNPYTGIIGLFHRVAASGISIDVYEDGEIGRDFIYIDDLIRQIVAAIHMPPSGTRVLDLGTGEAITVLAAAQRISELYGAPAPQISGKFRYGDVRWATCDATESKLLLGNSEFLSFAAGNERLSRWLSHTGVIPTGIY